MEKYSLDILLLKVQILQICSNVQDTAFVSMSDKCKSCQKVGF